jgi:putative drug exporter of the RND superfamily
MNNVSSDASPAVTDTPPADGSIWARLGSMSYRHRARVLIAWIAAFVIGGAAVAGVGTSTNGAFESPDSDSARGFELVEQYYGQAGSFLSGTIVFEVPTGVDDPAVIEVMDDFLIRVDDEIDTEDRLTVLSPFSDEGRQRGQISPDGTIAYAQVSFGSDVNETQSSEIGREIDKELDALRAELPADSRIELGGSALGEFEPPESELIGIAFAIVVLILAFGSVLAMGLPIGVALFGVGIGVTIIQLLTNVMSIPDFATTLGAMIGLGVGIDYALFIVTRYREGTRSGKSPHDAVVDALDTAGRAVIFAGLTVVISLLGMFVMGLSFINGLATGAAVTVLVTMVASVTLLPALIGFAQHRVEVTRWRGLIMAGGAALALLGAGLSLRPVALIGLVVLVLTLLASFVVPKLREALPPHRHKPLRDTISYRWSHFVQRHPWSSAIGVSVVLIALSLPVFGMRLGFSDESSFPEETTTRKAYDMLSDGFGPGSNGPLLLIGELSSPDQLETAGALVASLNATDGVATALGPIPSSDQQAVQIVVIPTTGPQDEATADLVERLRTDVVPAAIDGSSLQLYVTGAVASSIDFTKYLNARLPYFFVAVLALSFILLMMVFRSLLVPLKAVIMNLLSIGASYGIVVAVFQWGWGIELFGTATGPIEPFLPMMLFAIVFGLSMDYEVFLLSRVREEYDRTGDPVTSVADGLAATARVITAAAAIMVVVFGSFVLEDNRIIKMFGLGLASAVFLDATLVRMLLVPATMELLGAKNWWLPRWLDRILPQLNIEGHHDAAPAHEPDRDRDSDADPQLTPV